MPHQDAFDACRNDLYTPVDDLRVKYSEDIVQKVLRVRYMHQYYLSNPGATDAECVREDVSVHGVSRPAAYSDVRIIKLLLPMIAQASKDFHRWRYEEMILQTYNMAKGRGDTRTMERAATSFAKHTKIAEEESRDIPIDLLLPQPFLATDDPSVLGIKAVPNIRERQKKLLEKYLKETADIEDVEYEPADLLEDRLFAPVDNPADNEPI